MWLVLILFSVVLLILAYLDTKKPKNFPPGPKWLPVLGCFLEINRLKKKTGDLLHATNELSEQYGPIVGVRSGNDVQVIAFSHDAVKEMLSEDVFQGRPIGLFFEARSGGERRGILYTDDNFWAEQRRFIVRHLREFGLGNQDMSAIIEKEAQELVRRISNKVELDKNPVIEMTKLFSIPVLNTIWCMLTGVRFNPDDKPLNTLKIIVKKLFHHVDMVGSTFSHFPILKYIAPNISGYNDYIQAHRCMFQFFREELDRHKANFQAGKPKDFMDVYLEILNAPDRDPNFTELQLLTICLDFFTAGSDTTTKVLRFTILYLLLNPEIQKKAQEEIDQVIGRNRTPVLSDKVKMPYMQAIVYEGLRLSVGQSFFPVHRAIQDTTLQGYFIPKNTMLIANMHGTLMSEKLWDDPEVFRPERFLKNGKVNIPPTYFTFGLGKRRCPGESLGKANLFLFTTYLLQKFTLTVPPGHFISSKDTLAGITPTPKPFHALVTSRY